MAEHRTVDPKVGGSRPLTHAVIISPIFFLLKVFFNVLALFYPFRSNTVVYEL